MFSHINNCVLSTLTPQKAGQVKASIPGCYTAVLPLSFTEEIRTLEGVSIAENVNAKGLTALQQPECSWGMELLRQFCMLLHWDRSCRSDFVSQLLPIFWYQTNCPNINHIIPISVSAQDGISVFRKAHARSVLSIWWLSVADFETVPMLVNRDADFPGVFPVIFGQIRFLPICFPYSIFSYFIFLFLNFLSLFVFILCEMARTCRFSVIFAKVQWHPCSLAKHRSFLSRTSQIRCQPLFSTPFQVISTVMLWPVLTQKLPCRPVCASAFPSCKPDMICLCLL